MYTLLSRLYTCFFFFNDTATTEIYTLSLHDALPICVSVWAVILAGGSGTRFWPLSTPERPKQLLPLAGARPLLTQAVERSEEHTSELQSQSNIVCRLLLEKKKWLLSMAHLLCHASSY